MTKPSSRTIEREAADWVARLDRGALSPNESLALDAWIDSDVRRRGAYMRMQAIALHSERARALGADFDPATYSGPGTHLDGPIYSKATPFRATRRKFLWLGGGIAACAVGGLSIGILEQGQTYRTKLGEVRVVSLEDGSVVTLNTSSRMSVRFTKGQRLISLLEGEALFDVAHDKARPFIVNAGDTVVRAVGTSFTVRRIEDTPIEVLVREGVVEIAGPKTTTPIRVAANTRAVASSQGLTVATPIAPAAIARQLAWREGRLAFEGETLAEAATVFGRYSDTRIIVDPGVANEEITGLFAANDPVTFAKAAAASLDLRTETGRGEVRISR